MHKSHKIVITMTDKDFANISLSPQIAIIPATIAMPTKTVVKIFNALIFNALSNITRTYTLYYHLAISEFPNLVKLLTRKL